jgi:hypothetical protein
VRRPFADDTDITRPTQPLTRRRKKARHFNEFALLNDDLD